METEFEIRTPQEFTRVLREIKHALASGKLRQVRPAQAAFAMDDITSVNEDGPWPDYVEAYFEDVSTRAVYKLAVETYHGAGGSWARQ